MKKKNIKKTAQAPLEVSGLKKKHRENKPLTGQEIQDEIFKKMSAEKKIKLSSELTSFCLKLNRLNGNNKPRKTSYQNS